MLGNDCKSVDDRVVNLDQPRWLGHFIRMYNHRLSQYVVLNGLCRSKLEGN